MVDSSFLSDDSDHVSHYGGNGTSNHSYQYKLKLQDDLESPQEEQQFSTAQIISFSLPAAAVQIGWTVGEGLMLPYLLSIGISSIVASTVWLLNPMFGLFLQPLFGHISDQCTSQYGRRRPFLFLFYCGSLFGLISIINAVSIVECLTPYSAFDENNVATVPMIIVLFVGFAIMDCSHDLLMMPSRALLNDCLSDEQTEVGNSLFALVSSLGSCIGLTMVILPLDTIWPLSLLTIPIRSTFTLAAILIFACNIVTSFVTASVDKPILDREHSELGISYSDNSLNLHADSNPVVRPSEENKAANNSFLSILSILPRPLVVLWFVQLVWWYSVLHINIWWTSWMAVDVYGASHDSEGSRMFNEGVRAGTVGLLIQAIIQFSVTPMMTRMNSWLGITNYYHLCAIAYGCASISAYFINSVYYSVIVMIIQGMVVPAIFTSPFILIEVHAFDPDDDDDSTKDRQERQEQHNQLDIHYRKVIGHNPSVSNTAYEDLPKDEENHPLLSVNENDSDNRFTIAILEEWRGVLTALFNVTMICAQIVIGTTSGLIIESFGNIGIVFLLSGSILVVVNIIVLLFSLTRPADSVVERMVDSSVSTPTSPATIERKRSLNYGTWNRSNILSTAYGPLKQEHMRRSRSAPALVLSTRPAIYRRHKSKQPIFGAKGGRVFGMSRGARDALALECLRERSRLFGLMIKSKANRTKSNRTPTSRPYHHVSNIQNEDSSEFSPSLSSVVVHDTGRLQVEEEPHLHHTSNDLLYQTSTPASENQQATDPENDEPFQDDQITPIIMPSLRALRSLRFSQSMSILPSTFELQEEETDTNNQNNNANI